MDSKDLTAENSEKVCGESAGEINLKSRPVNDRPPQTAAEARKLFGLGPDDDLYDVYGSASVFLR